MRTILIAAVALSFGFGAVATAEAAGMMKPMMSPAASCKGEYMYWDAKTKKCLNSTQS
jgi:hypothetical protein